MADKIINEAIIHVRIKKLKFLEYAESMVLLYINVLHSNTLYEQLN